jgi:hypothetical protein
MGRIARPPGANEEERLRAGGQGKGREATEVVQRGSFARTGK